MVFPALIAAALNLQNLELQVETRSEAMQWEGDRFLTHFPDIEKGVGYGA